MKSWGNAIKGELQLLAERGRRCWWRSDDLVRIRILPSSGMCLPRDSTEGRIGGTIGPTQRNLMGSNEVCFLRAKVRVCLRRLPPVCGFLRSCTYAPEGGRTPFWLQMNSNLKNWSFVSRSNWFGCGFSEWFLSLSFSLPVADVLWWVAAAEWRSTAC